MGDSPFLKIDPQDWVAANALAFAVRDRYPVSPGHTLVIPKRVVPTWFEATEDEQRAHDHVDPGRVASLRGDRGGRTLPPGA